MKRSNSSIIVHHHVKHSTLLQIIIRRNKQSLLSRKTCVRTHKPYLVPPDILCVPSSFPSFLWSDAGATWLVLANRVTKQWHIWATGVKCRCTSSSHLSLVSWPWRLCAPEGASTEGRSHRIQTRLHQSEKETTFLVLSHWDLGVHLLKWLGSPSLKYQGTAFHQ